MNKFHEEILAGIPDELPPPKPYDTSVSHTPVRSVIHCERLGSRADDVCGSVTRGKFANLTVTRPMRSLTMIPYCYQTPVISRIMLKGAVI